jgi:YD repeat-containing protein
MTATWTWDTATTGVGKLASSTTNGGVTTAYTYDAIGRNSSRAMTIDGTTYTTWHGFDSVGRKSLLVYPTGFQVKHIYTGPGYLAEIRDNVSNVGFPQ